jgi:hypothetical protein
VKKSLIISSMPVVGDLTRNNPDPCLAVPADAAKKWNLGYLLTQASSASPSSTTATNYVNRWLSTWSTDQTVNGQTLTAIPPLQPSGLGPFIRDQWHQKSGSSTSYKMEYAPYRLSAIVPRFDLRKRRRFGEGLAGELRFVFGHVDLLDVDPDPSDPSGFVQPNGGGCATTRQSSLILEYAVDKANENDVVTWAKAWTALSNETLGSATYLSKLESLTESVVKAGKGTPFGRPNGSELIRIRVVENPTAGGTWTFREWDVSGSTKLPEPATVKQSPMLEQRLEGSSFVGTWANANVAAIKNDTYVVPDTFPWGPRMLGVRDLDDSNGGVGAASKREWRVGFADGEERHLFNLGTCNGCHSTETGTNFSHIQTRWRRSEAPLSQFLTGANPEHPEFGPFFVTDPVDGTTVRYFNEAEKRASDLMALSYGWTENVPEGITTPALATFFKLVDWNTGKCLDVNGNSNGSVLQQWSCSGNANQRITPIDLGNGYYNLRVKQGTGNCLQAASAANSSGQWLVTQQPCGTATSQQVQITSSSYYEMHFRNTGRCLDLADSNNGTKALQKSCTDASSQQFYLVE